jgi:prophage regulatory protein
MSFDQTRLASMDSITLLKLEDVLSIVNLGKTTIYGLVKQGRFPPPTKPTERTARWLASDINDWVNALRSKSVPLIQPLRRNS